MTLAWEKKMTATIASVLNAETLPGLPKIPRMPYLPRRANSKISEPIMRRSPEAPMQSKSFTRQNKRSVLSKEPTQVEVQSIPPTHHARKSQNKNLPTR